MTVELAFDAKAICGVELGIVVDAGEGEGDVEGLRVCADDDGILLPLELA